VVGVDQAILAVGSGAHYSTYSCAVLADTSAVCWGGNAHWQLGARVETPTATPVVVGSGDHTTD